MIALFLALLSSPVVAGPPNQYPGNLTAQTTYIDPNTASSTDGKYAFSVDCYRLQSADAATMAEMIAEPGYFTFNGAMASSVLFNPTDKHGVMLYPGSLMVPPLSTAYPNNYFRQVSDTPAFRTTFTYLSPRYTGTAEIFEDGIPSTYTMSWNVFIVVTGNWYWDGSFWWFVLDDTLNGIGGENALPNPYVDSDYNHIATLN